MCTDSKTGARDERYITAKSPIVQRLSKLTKPEIELKPVRPKTLCTDVRSFSFSLALLEDTHLDSFLWRLMKPSFSCRRLSSVTQFSQAQNLKPCSSELASHAVVALILRTLQIRDFMIFVTDPSQGEEFLRTVDEISVQYCKVSTEQRLPFTCYKWLCT